MRRMQPAAIPSPPENESAPGNRLPWSPPAVRVMPIGATASGNVQWPAEGKTGSYELSPTPS